MGYLTVGTVLRHWRPFLRARGRFWHVWATYVSRNYSLHCGLRATAAVILMNFLHTSRTQIRYHLTLITSRTSQNVHIINNMTLILINLSLFLRQ